VNNAVAVELITSVTMAAVSVELTEMNAQTPALPETALAGVCGKVTAVGGVPTHPNVHPVSEATALEMLAAGPVKDEVRARPAPATVVHGPPGAPRAAELAAPSAAAYAGVADNAAAGGPEKAPSQNRVATIRRTTTTTAPTATPLRRRATPGGSAGWSSVLGSGTLGGPEGSTGGTPNTRPSTVEGSVPIKAGRRA
jgi:hypothetical protein